MINPTPSTKKAAWCRSAFCNGAAACFEFAVQGDLVLMRDSKNPDGPVLTFPCRDWVVLLDQVVKDPENYHGRISVEGGRVPGYFVRDRENPDSATLWFSREEWKAFVAGVRECRFTPLTLTEAGR